MSRFSTNLLASLVVSLGIVGFPHEELKAALIYEGFEYPAGVAVEGLNGGSPSTSFSAPWDDLVSDLSTNPNIPPQSLITPAGLAYMGSMGTPLLVNGNAASLATSPSQPTLNGTEIDRDLTNFAFVDGSNYWLSFLIRKDTGDTPGIAGDIGTVSILPTGGKPSISIGDTISGVNFGIRRNANVLVANSAQIPAVGTTYFLVVRLTFGLGATDSVDLYINPEPGIAPSASAATLNGLDIPGISRYRAMGASGVGNNATYSVDEIRLGNTYAEVAPVPEPSSLLLAGLGLAGVASRRRRIA